jgi:hypothetical protein
MERRPQVRFTFEICRYSGHAFRQLSAISDTLRCNKMDGHSITSSASNCHSSGHAFGPADTTGMRDTIELFIDRIIRCFCLNPQPFRATHDLLTNSIGGKSCAAVIPSRYDSVRRHRSHSCGSRRCWPFAGADIATSNGHVGRHGYTCEHGRCDGGGFRGRRRGRSYAVLSKQAGASGLQQGLPADGVVHCGASPFRVAAGFDCSAYFGEYHLSARSV